jgi:hypothetical protein
MTGNLQAAGSVALNSFINLLLLGGAKPYSIGIVDMHDTAIGSISTDETSTNLYISPANDLILQIGGTSESALYYQFDLENGFTVNQGAGNVFSLSPAGVLNCASLQLAGTTVLSGQMASIAALGGGAALADVITAFNQLLTELKAVNLMASP